jgi:hypothetical protein
MQRLEIAADGHGLGDRRAIIEDQDRHPLHGVERGECLAELLHIGEVHLAARHLDALLGQEYAHAPRARRPPAIVKLHAFRPPARFQITGAAAEQGSFGLADATRR